MDVDTESLDPSVIQLSARSSSGRHKRNLIVCIDGTSNQFGRRNTNVVKLFDAIDRKTTHPEQLAYYSSGIGTRPKTANILDRVVNAVSDIFDMAVAWSIDKNIKEAYGWLAGKYQKGDQIFLFGFSRGAYQVRVLAGMIHEVGLIRTPTERQIATAYNYYEAIRPGNPEARQIARKFQKTFSWENLTVHFIGVWDTVSSVGFGGDDISRSMSSYAYHIRHALALDERRVKFMPEYFRKMNLDSTSDSLDIAHAYTSVNDFCSDVEEVWFAGSHSDVGGKDRPGSIYHAGNISLLWMCREAAANGLVLRLTDITWGPGDIDFGTKNSMSHVWRFFEYLTIRHQVSFGGGGNYARQMHRLQPRRIMPHQKVHASVLYANAYKPVAMRGGGLNIPMIYTRPEDTKLYDLFWETDLFGDAEAKELVNSLGSQRGVATIYLDKLLFMLRFKKGKKCVRNVHNWERKFIELIHHPECAPLFKLVTIVAYYEAASENPALSRYRLSPAVLHDAKECLKDILAKHKHRDNPRVVSLFRILTKHEDLRMHILTQDILDTFMDLLDSVIVQRVNFLRVMDGLDSLLQCEATCGVVIGKLGANYSDSNMSRLSRILDTNDPRFLNAALRMMLTLAQIQDASSVCSVVKPRICDLATKHGTIIGPLAVEIMLTLYHPDEQRRLYIRDAQLRANLASVFVRMNLDEHSLASKQRFGVASRQQILGRVFGLDASKLSVEQKQLIKKLKDTVQKRNARVRTATTMTLLKLCETRVIREYLREIGLLDVFINQLRYKDSALLAAYALAVCLAYSDMKESIKEVELLPKYIVGMLWQDHFNDAIGQVEGLQIFTRLIQHSCVWEKMIDFNMEFLGSKAGDGQLMHILSILLSMDRIFRVTVEDTPSPFFPIINEDDWNAALAQDFSPAEWDLFFRFSSSSSPNTAL